MMKNGFFGLQFSTMLFAHIAQFKVFVRLHPNIITKLQIRKKNYLNETFIEFQQEEIKSVVKFQPFSVIFSNTTTGKSQTNLNII